MSELLNQNNTKEAKYMAALVFQNTLRNTTKVSKYLTSNMDRIF